MSKKIIILMIIYPLLNAFSFRSVAAPKETTKLLLNQNISLFDFGMERLKNFIFGLNGTIKSIDKDVVGIIVDYDKDKDFIWVQILKDLSVKDIDETSYKKECEDNFSFLRRMFLVDSVQQGKRKHSLIADQFSIYDKTGNQVSDSGSKIDEMVHLRFVGNKNMCEAKFLSNESTIFFR